MIPRRLDKFISDATGLSRNAIRRAWKAGRIEVESAHDVTALHALIFEDDVVRVDGEVVELRAPRAYFAFHKPAGVLTASSDPYGRACLDGWLDAMPGAFHVGRLDRATTGLLLFTDDGDLANFLLQPQRHVDKEYRLVVEGRIASDAASLHELSRGVLLEDGLAQASAVRVCGGTASRTFIRLTLSEGRNRQVRRMAARVGLRLSHLHRTRIANVRLGPVAPGSMRRLTPQEIDGLWKAVGGRELAAKQLREGLHHRLRYEGLDPRCRERLERWFAAQAED